MNPDDFDEDGNNIVPCPICGAVYGSCDETAHAEFAAEVESKDLA